MRVGTVREIKNHEYRVGLTPESVRELAAHGHEVWVEQGAGLGIGATDRDYEAAGAVIQPDARAVFEEIWGGYDERLYARAKCYGFAEAVRGGLIGAWADHCDPGTLEYSKFSDWMFLWARVGLSDHAVDDYLRSL